MSSVQAMQSLSESATRFGRSRASQQRTGAIAGSLLDFGGAAADAFDVLPRRYRSRGIL
jgi:hypothetical protein